MTTPAIHLEDVRKTYGELAALDGLTLAIESGELFGVLGPNGAGKTTTMEILTGQQIPDSGTVSVAGLDPVAEPVEVRRQVGILPEDDAPPSFMTPREYFAFVADVRDLAAETLEDRIGTWSDRMRIGDHLDTLATDLSRGQQQKVMIAGAFLHDPAIVFIDEPLVNLDPVIQERFKSYLQTYQAAGNTVVLSTHNIEVAEALCTRVGIVYDGELLATVRPADLAEDEQLLDVFLDRVEAGDEAVAGTHD